MRYFVNFMTVKSFLVILFRFLPSPVITLVCVLLPHFLYAIPGSNQNRNLSVFSFVENKGQITDQYNNTRSDIDARLSGSGVNIFIGKGAIHYQWNKHSANALEESFDPAGKEQKTGSD